MDRMFRIYVYMREGNWIALTRSRPGSPWLMGEYSLVAKNTEAARVEALRRARTSWEKENKG